MELIELPGATERNPVAPLIKWPGGKRSISAKIIQHFPNEFGTYHEPFVGGGAIFFALRPTHATLSDLNSELIDCYRVVRDQPDKLIQVLRRLPNSEDDYYRVREMQPRTLVTKAARLLYLTRLSFNGIHRVNLKGKFNVPYGQKTHLKSCDENAIRLASAALAKVTLHSGDFENATADAREGDLIYLDPPYTVAHQNNGFVKYNEKIFSWADQMRLMHHAKLLAAKGCTVIISNAEHKSVRTLYAGVKAETIDRYSVISASSKHRRRISECVFVLTGGGNA